MQTKHKIEAYTLSEMVIVIIITTIVMGMAFSVLSMVQKHMKGIQVNLSRNLEIDKMEQLINLDFNRFSKISYRPLEDELMFSSEIDTTTYKFHENFLVTPFDTLHVKIESKQFYFNGERISEGRIDALKLITSKVAFSQTLFVYKQNSAASFLD